MTKKLSSCFLTNLKLNRIVFVFLILIYHNFTVLAQFTGSNYQFPERFSSTYYFNPNLSYQKIKNIQVPGFTAEQMEYYKILKTYNTQKGFDNNSYYLEWNELEKYLYKLVDTILPLNIKAKQPFDVFIERSIDYNAHALGNGFVFANIGLIAECKTEAELAYVLSHEIGHSVFNHGYMINSDLLSSFNQNDISGTIINYNKMFEKSQAAELQSDSFAYQCINSVNYNLNAIKTSLDLIGYSEYVSQFYVSEFQRSSYKEYLNKFSTHPSYNKRFKLLSKNISSIHKPGKNFIIDSVYFNKVKKFAHEECKKISMEEGDYQSTIKLSFIDYLGGDNSLKNLFYLFESIRRFLYAHPENSKKGFLAEDLQFTEFENTNYSILKKPELLFVDSLAFVKCEKHLLIENPEKPFNTYEDAFLFFSNIGEEKHFNESQFSKALFYYSKKDIENFNKYLGNYLEKGGGIYTEFC